MSKYKKAVLALIIANTIWGIGAPIFKWSFTTLHPYTLSFFRFIFAAIIILFISKGNVKVKLKDSPKVFLAGFLAIFINIVFFLVGIQKTLSINAPIIGSSEPIFLLFSAIIFLNEKPTKRIFLGNLLGLTGVLLIVIEPLLISNHTGSFIGNLLLVISMLGTVSGAILAKETLKKYSALTLAFWSFLVSSICILPFFVNEVQTYTLISQISFEAVVAILFGVIFSSTIAYFLYYWGLKQIPASQTSVFLYIDPIAAILVAMPLVHEYPNGFFIIGSILVFLGIYIAEGRLHYHPFHKLLK